MKICTYQNVMNQQSNLTHHFPITLNPRTKRMGSLVEVLKDPAVRPLVVADCEKMLDAEIADKKGLSGIAVKGAFKTLKAR